MDRILRRRQLLELIGVSNSTQWRLEKAGDFPARVKLGRASVSAGISKRLRSGSRTGRGFQARPPLGAATTLKTFFYNLAKGGYGDTGGYVRGYDSVLEAIKGLRSFA
jgi:hypothetical protein